MSKTRRLPHGLLAVLSFTICLEPAASRADTPPLAFFTGAVTVGASGCTPTSGTYDLDGSLARSSGCNAIFQSPNYDITILPNSGSPATDTSNPHTTPNLAVAGFSQALVQGAMHNESKPEVTFFVNGSADHGSTTGSQKVALQVGMFCTRAADGSRPGPCWGMNNDVQTGRGTLGLFAFENDVNIQNADCAATGCIAYGFWNTGVFGSPGTAGYYATSQGSNNFVGVANISNGTLTTTARTDNGNPAQYGSFTSDTTVLQITPGTVSFTGSISGSTLTVSAVASGTLAIGQTIYDPNATIIPVQITAQQSGTAGGTGTYTTSATNYSLASGQMYAGTQANHRVNGAVISTTTLNLSTDPGATPLNLANASYYWRTHAYQFGYLQGNSQDGPFSANSDMVLNDDGYAGVNVGGNEYVAFAAFNAALAKYALQGNAAQTVQAGYMRALASGGGASAGVLVSANQPAIGWQTFTGVTDANIWDQLVVGTSMYFRAVNDANTAANAGLRFDRSGYSITLVALGAPVAPSQYSVTSAPPCTSTLKGSEVVFTDVAGTPAYRQTGFAGGGTQAVPAVCNGTAWEEH